MISWIRRISSFVRGSPTLHNEMCGRELTGLYISENAARFRFSDGTALLINLDTRTFLMSPAQQWREWITFPGWLRVTGVKEYPHQIILTVTGVIYSSRIVLNKQGERWQVSLGNGRIF